MSITTVRDLIDALQKFDPNSTVFIELVPEGKDSYCIDIKGIEKFNNVEIANNGTEEILPSESVSLFGVPLVG